MFAHYGVEYRSVDLDSVAYQAEGRGSAIRGALAERTSMTTIPQIFIDGEFIGGATDLFEAWRAGRAQRLLERSGVAYDRSIASDPYGFLPSWLQPR
jgi:cysteine synthase A